MPHTQKCQLHAVLESLTFLPNNTYQLLRQSGGFNSEMKKSKQYICRLIMLLHGTIHVRSRTLYDYVAICPCLYPDRRHRFAVIHVLSNQKLIR